MIRKLLFALVLVFIICGSVAFAGVCGNGVREGAEQCDTHDFGSMNCVLMRYDFGTLSCNSDCTINASECSLKPPKGTVTTDRPSAEVGPTGMFVSALANPAAILQVVLGALILFYIYRIETKKGRKK